MLKLVTPAKDGSGKLILFGLSRRNCDLLLQGKPIIFDGDELELPGIRFVLMAGETEQNMMADLEKAGFKLF